MMKKVTLITGASSGIGADLAREFASGNNNLVLVARREERLVSLKDELTKEFGVDVYCISEDLSKNGAAKRIVSKVEELGLIIETLVNNAGTQIYGKHQNVDLEKEIAMIQTNLVSLTELTKYSIKHMKKLNSGNILNVGSTGSFAPAPYDAVYQATKAYVLFYTEGIAEDLKGTGINVSILCPGATKTEFSNKANMSDVLLFKYMTMSSKIVARAGYKGLLKGKRIVIPGLLNKMIVFSVRLLPRNLMIKIAGLLLSK